MKNDMYQKIVNKYNSNDIYSSHIKIGNYNLYKLNSDDIKNNGGKDYQNLVCYKEDELIWIGDFPQDDTLFMPIGGPITGISVSLDSPDKIIAHDWSGEVYEVDIATGSYERIGWTK